MQAITAPATVEPLTPPRREASPCALRAKLRRLTPSERERRCGVYAVRDTGPSIDARGQPGNWKARYCGVLTCGHVWTCPVCSERIRGKKRDDVCSAVEKGGGIWQMVTFTLRHRWGMPLGELISGLMGAFRKLKTGRGMGKLWKKRVKATVRALEATYGSAGWHPHIHLLMHTDGFSSAEQAKILARWRAVVREVLGPDCEPDDEHGVKWSNPIDWCKADERDRARYLVKMGLELSGPKKTKKKGKTVSHWTVAALAADGDERMRHEWTAFYRGTKGRRMIELDDRAKAYTRRPALPLPFGVNVAEPCDVLPERVISISLDGRELRALRHYEARDPSILSTILGDVAKAEDPRVVVRSWLTHIAAVMGYTSPRGTTSTPEPLGVFAHAAPRRESARELVYLVGEDGELSGPTTQANAEGNPRGHPYGGEAQAQGP